MNGSGTTFGEISRAVEQSPLAMLVMSLPDRRVRAVSDAAVELFGGERQALCRQRLADLMIDADAQEASRSLSAMTAGDLDSYRARRTLRTVSGLTEASVWVRLLHTASRRLAVCIVARDDDPQAAHQSIAMFFGPDAADLAIGTLDDFDRIERISPSSRLMLGRDQSELAGGSLLELVHPDDAPALAASLQSAEQQERDTVTLVRMQHATRGWTSTRCLLLPIKQAGRSKVAFVLAGTAHGSASQADPQRVAMLEAHLLRIGAVLHEAGLTANDPFAADVSRFPALGELPARQRDIVDRLLRGDRIPAIAGALYLSPSTIRNHLSQVFTRFGVHSQSELLSVLRSELDAPSA